MSTAYNAARTYLAESYDLTLAEQYETEYAVLPLEARKAFDDFVDGQAEVLARRVLETFEVYMTDADPLPDAVTEGLS